MIDAAVAAGVDLLAYTSLTRADRNPLALAPDHAATERAIEDSGVPAVILRNNWYTENFALDLRLAADTGVLEASVGAGRVASATRFDYADAAAAVLSGDGHAGAVYELAGDTAWNYDDLAVAMTEVLGRPVVYREQRPEDRRSALITRGIGEAGAEFLIGLETGIRDGALDIDDRSLSRLLGRPTSPLIDGLRAAAATPAPRR